MCCHDFALAGSLSSVLMLFAAACGDDDVTAMPDAGPGDAGPQLPDDSRPECENVNPASCLLPWPSSRYLAEDSTTATGLRIELPVDAMPQNNERVPVDPAIFAPFDGFSPMTSMVTLYPGNLDVTNLPDEHHIEDSLAAGSPTVLLDAETGDRVAHFSERDDWRHPSNTVLYVRPAVRLEENRRYIVAIRDIRYADGTPVEPSPYFRALRDGEPSESDELEARRAHFDDVFGKLETAGVPRDGLLEAWDFHTASGETLWGDLLSMRDQALAIVGDRGIGCTVTSVEEDVEEHLFRRVEGTFTVPLFMENEYPGARMVRDASGSPMTNGMAEVPFKLHIPRSVADRVTAGGAPGPLLTYGHGLFGERHEADAGWLLEWTNTAGLVVVATDWWGMSREDRLNAGETLTDMSRFPSLAERLLQSVVNFLVMTRSFVGVCSELAEAAAGGMPVIDVDQRYYLGISQGGIMGMTVAGVSTDIERFVVGVAGISYPIMMKRSSNFGPFGSILDAWYPDQTERDLLLVMSASHWDLGEPATYAPHVVADPLAGTTPKRILVQTGWYDAQVPNISSDIAARTMGIPLMAPSVREVWSIEETAGPADSAYVQYKIDGVEAIEPGTRSPRGDNPAHEGVRRNAHAQQQMQTFLTPDGQVVHYCDGACDPL